MERITISTTWITDYVISEHPLVCPLFYPFNCEYHNHYSGQFSLASIITLFCYNIINNIVVLVNTM